MAAKRKGKIKILLVDDHPVVREGVRSSLTVYDHLDVVGEARDGEEAIHQISALCPDVVLMDISMPRVSGLEAMKRIQKALPGTKVIMLTMHDNKEYIEQIVRSGARGYVLKDIYPAELVKAIETVSEGDVFFSPMVNRIILDGYVKDERNKEDVAELSQRERQVLSLIAEGCTNKIIAMKLFVSVRTVETHRERIMRKLDIHTAAGLTKFAIAKGVVKLN